MHFATLLAVALPILSVSAAPAATTTSLYEAPRPSGVPGFFFTYTTGTNYAASAGATAGAYGGGLGGGFQPGVPAASGEVGGADAGTTAILEGSISPSGAKGCAEFGATGICLSARAVQTAA